MEPTCSFAILGEIPTNLVTAQTFWSVVANVDFLQIAELEHHLLDVFENNWPALEDADPLSRFPKFLAVYVDVMRTVRQKATKDLDTTRTDLDKTRTELDKTRTEWDKTAQELKKSQKDARDKQRELQSTEWRLSSSKSREEAAQQQLQIEVRYCNHFRSACSLRETREVRGNTTPVHPT